MPKKSRANEARRPSLTFTILKSGFSGAFMTVLAVALGSPAGLGGMIGSSFASVDGRDPVSTDEGSPLPRAPQPLTELEITAIQDQLAGSVAALESAHVATDAKIDHLRAIAQGGNMMSFAATQPAPRDANAELADMLLRGTSPS